MIGKECLESNLKPCQGSPVSELMILINFLNSFYFFFQQRGSPGSHALLGLEGFVSPGDLQSPSAGRPKASVLLGPWQVGGVCGVWAVPLVPPGPEHHMSSGELSFTSDPRKKRHRHKAQQPTQKPM